MNDRLAKVKLTLDSVVKMDVLLRDVWNIPIMEAVFKRRFKGNYPARKTISTESAHWEVRRDFRYRLMRSRTGADNKIIGPIINKMRLYYNYLNKKVCISTDF